MGRRKDCHWELRESPSKSRDNTVEVQPVA